MKVFFLNAVCGTGSTGRIVTDLAALLQSRGHDVKIAFGVGQARNITPEAAFKMNTLPGYYLHNALSRLTDHAGLYSLPQTGKLIREMEKFSPDVVHIHTLHGYYVNYELLFSYLTKADIPVVMTLHDCWTFTGHCTHFDYAGCDQWKIRCENCPQLRRYPVCYGSGDVGRNFDRKKKAFTAPKTMCIVTASRWQAELVKQSFLGKYPVRVIPNGIDPSVFHPTPGAQLPEGKKILLGAAGVWDDRKGLQDFEVLAELLGEDYQIVLVGLRPEQQQALPKSILGLCRTDNAAELAKLYTAADLFVNPTYEESFSMVNLEAQACGTPVITYRTGGAPETLLPGMGRVVPKGDVEAMAQAIREGISPPTHIPTALIGKDFACSRYLELYRQLTEK